jgi:hypothetical protein
MTERYHRYLLRRLWQRDKERGVLPPPNRQEVDATSTGAPEVPSPARAPVRPLYDQDSSAEVADELNHWRRARGG